jgi:hypothetical protein
VQKDFCNKIGTTRTSRNVRFPALASVEQSAIVDHRCVLAIEDYSFRQRATILYNHLYFSDLTPEYKQSLIDDDFYLEIVRHKKFNPRLIEWLSTYRRVRDVAADAFRLFVRDLLHNPSEIWRHAYERQISEAGRRLNEHLGVGSAAATFAQGVVLGTFIQRVTGREFSGSSFDWDCLNWWYFETNRILLLNARLSIRRRRVPSHPEEP